jgi:hypothetical protein
MENMPALEIVAEQAPTEQAQSNIVEHVKESCVEDLLVPKTLCVLDDLACPQEKKQKTVHTPLKEIPFKIVLEGARGLENYCITAGNASTAISKVVRERVASLPLQLNVRIWVQSKQRVYEHAVMRDYDNPRRKGFTNRRVKTYKPVELSAEMPSFSFLATDPTQKIQN